MRRGPVVGSLVGVAVLALLPTVATAQPEQLHEELRRTDAERARVEEELDDARDAERNARSELEAVESQLAGAEADLQELEGALEAAEQRLGAARAQETTARQHLGAVTAELDAVERELADKRVQLESRVIAAFKYGQTSLAEAILASEDIVEFLNSGSYVASVLDHDRELVDDITGLAGDVEVQRQHARALQDESSEQAQRAAEAAEEVEEAAQEQRRLTELISDRRAQREALFTELREDRRSIEGHLAGLEAESQRIEQQLAEIARQQAEELRRREEAERRAAQRRREVGSGGADVAAGAGGAAGVGGQSGVGPGGWSRPVPGPASSMFGPRWGRSHNGVDLRGDVGTPVRAAASGRVVQVTSSCHPTSSWGCGGGFGNYITISHDSGLATIYAHLSRVHVGTGTSVAAGQVIGEVGNAGNSYGPHLHLEVREAGVPRDPCGYIGC